MLISISKNALNDPDGEYYFRLNTITALRIIVDGGRSVLISPDTLSNEQRKIFEQEGIIFEADGTADLEIETNDDRLVLTGEGKELVKGEHWGPIVTYIAQEARKATIKRQTKETNIEVEVKLDGTGRSEISTGLKFFDHMLEQISRHGLVDIRLKCEGDLEVDEHHTIEDVAIALGEGISSALGNRQGIERYGFVLPMDEAQARVAIDFSSRPYLNFEGEFDRERVGDVPTEMVKHFFYSLAMNMKATLHLNFDGENDHHKIEACFKGFARALKSAIERNDRIKGQIPSSKGKL